VADVGLATFVIVKAGVAVTHTVTLLDPPPVSATVSMTGN
jgi:hypothetical protein